MLPASSNQGLAQANPQEALIRAQNARRVQTRAAYASLAQSVTQTDFDALRRDPKRQIGGQFEKLQKLPPRQKAQQQGITDADLNRFLSSFHFAAQADVVPRKNIVVPGQSRPNEFTQARLAQQSIFANASPFGGIGAVANNNYLGGY